MPKYFIFKFVQFFNGSFEDIGEQFSYQNNIVYFPSQFLLKTSICYKGVIPCFENFVDWSDNEAIVAKKKILFFTASQRMELCLSATNLFFPMR